MKKGTTTKPFQRMSVEDYISFEEQRAKVRHEYVDGRLIPMPGDSSIKNLIGGNICFALREKLKGTLCKVFFEFVKVQIVENSHYTYPDVFVTCDARDLESPYIKKYPSVIVEVASPSTKVYDKTDKFLDYRKIASLRHYLVVDTERELVECFSTKDGKEWESEIYTSKNDSVPLTAINISLSLSAIY